MLVLHLVGTKIALCISYSTEGSAAVRVISVREAWSRQSYSTRRSLVLYGYRDHASSTNISVQHVPSVL